MKLYEIIIRSIMIEFYLANISVIYCI